MTYKLKHNGHTNDNVHMSIDTQTHTNSKRDKLVQEDSNKHRLTA